ncbi:acyl--CoA ligase [Candidatus Fermentibacteria bacterium]|nr:acyl--CoA ligase [Candidatus Fermentibacteria bacterium]
MDPCAHYASLPAIIADRAARTPDAPFLAWADGVTTYSACAEDSARRAAGFLGLGMHPKDLVLSLLSTRRDAVLALLAASWAKVVLAPANKWLSPQSLSALITYINPDWIIADEASAHLLVRYRRILPPSERWIMAPAGGDTEPWTSRERTKATLPAPDFEPDDTCYVDFTSGSTGMPKGVPRTHGSIHSISLSAIQALGLQPHDRHLSLFAAFAHPHETVARAAVLGGMLVCVDSLRPSTIAEAVARHGVTCIMAVPTVYSLLSRRIDDPRFATLRLLESGGAVTPEPLIERYRSRLGIPLTPVWGCTEAGGIAVASPSGQCRIQGSVGKLCPGFRSQLTSDDPSDSDQEGELLLRGPSLAREYFRLPDETALAFRDGWYHSGDVFTCDTQGFYFFRGRTDEMIKVKALKVFPSEIEQTLLAHPKVAEAAVVPENGQDRLLAFVACAPGETITAQVLRAFCRERLEPFKVPRIILLPSLPKTPSGKILKRALSTGLPRPPQG